MSTEPFVQLIIALLSGRCASETLRFGGIDWPISRLSTVFCHAMEVESPGIDVEDAGWSSSYVRVGEHSLAASLG
jgi:hypothetical protein